jgi:hypothetical protein
MIKPSGFNKKAYRYHAFVLLVLLIAGFVYLDEWISHDGDLVRPAAAIFAAVMVILLSKWKRFLFILTFQTLGALGIIGAMRGFVTAKSIVIPLIGVGISIGALLLMKVERREEQWLLREVNTNRQPLQGLGLRANETKDSDDKE